MLLASLDDMRLLTLLAVAALAAGVYHYRQRRGPGRSMVAPDRRIVPGGAQGTHPLDLNEPVGDLGPMQSGIATGI